MGQPLPDYGQPPTASSLSKATQSIAGPSGSVSDGPPILQTRPRALPAAPRGPPPTKVAAPLNPVVHTVQRVPARMISSNSVTCVASQAEHTVRGGLPQSSASRPPPTLFARRVLPPSAATAPGFQGAELKHAPPPASLTTFTREQPTLTREQPVASTSYGSATTILPRNVGLDPAVQSSQPWLCHQRAVTVPADKSPSSGQIKLRAAEPEEMRPASACSLSSSVSTSLTSPSKEPFRPSSSASSRSRDNGDDQAWQAPTASTGHRPLATEHPAKPEVSQQRRTVPMQVHRAPTRATRRASRVLPPSTDLQAFLSSTATAAASDFQWPSTASATTRLPTTTAPVEIPTKRPASAMSSNSLSNSLVANAVTVVSVERSASPSGRQSPMHAHPADGALAKGTEVSEHVVETILRTPESNHDNSNLEAVSVALPNVPVENYAEPKSPSHEATQTPLTNVAVSTIDANPGVDHQVTSLAAESEASRFSEPAKVAQSVSMASLASLPDTLNGLAEEIAPQTDNSEGKAAVEEVRSSAISDMALSSEQVATLPNGSPAAPAGIDNVSKDAVRSVDIAALAANLPLAKGTPADDISRPVLAGNRQKTAFRPQKHHKPTEELAWIPLPTLTTDTLQMDTGASRSALSGSTANNADHATLTSAVREAKPSVPVQQQPLKSSLNLGRSPVPPEPVPREVRSVSAMTGSMPSHAKPADLLRSSHPVRAARPRQPVGAASRTLQVSDKAKPPPTKKQASSSSTGPRTERPRFGAGGGVARSLIPSDKPAVSASSSRLPASKASSARQGSIFSRLTAPTAASAGKAKPRIPSEAKETFKRPLPSSRPVNKKPSTMSLKSSQGAADRQPRPLKDETNIGSMSRVQETASVDGKGRKGTDEAVVSPQSQDDRGPLLAEGPSATLLADMAIAAENVKDSARVMKDNVSYEDGKEAGHSIAAVSMSTATLKSQEGLSSAGVPTLTSNAGPADTSPLLAAASIPLPSSPTPPAANEHPFQSTSILAELGFRPAGAFDANKVFTSPTALPVGPSSDGVGQRRLDQGPASPLPAHDHHLSADEEVPDLGRDRASMPDSEGNGQDTRNKSSMHNRSVDENTESFAMADATVIVHDLEELGLNSITETDVAVEQTQVPAETDGQLDREGPEVMTQPAELTDSVLSESESAPMKPNTQTVSDARVITSVDEHHASHSPVPADIPLPQDVTMTFDASLSMLASPTRGMQELLARSTGPQGLEERSPLLLEKEYLPEIGAGQYEYDETVLDAYSTTSGSAGS